MGTRLPIPLKSIDSRRIQKFAKLWKSGKRNPSLGKTLSWVERHFYQPPPLFPVGHRRMSLQAFVWQGRPSSGKPGSGTDSL